MLGQDSVRVGCISLGSLRGVRFSISVPGLADEHRCVRCAGMHSLCWLLRALDMVQTSVRLVLTRNSPGLPARPVSALSRWFDDLCRMHWPGCDRPQASSGASRDPVLLGGSAQKVLSDLRGIVAGKSISN